MDKKINVFESRLAALFASQEALNLKGLRGDEFVIESYREIRRGPNKRFVVLFLATRKGAKATTAISLKKVDGSWKPKVRVMQIGENAPIRYLGRLVARVDVENAIKLINAFISSFPSLQGIDPKDVIRAVTVPRTDMVSDEVSEMVAQGLCLERIQSALEEASYGEWPGKMIIGDTSTWCHSTEITLIPYVGDRTITIHGAGIGFGHGLSEGYVTVTIDCMKRPSASAMSGVIQWIRENEERFRMDVLWSEKPRSDREDSLFESNRAIAQYFEMFAPEEERVPYRTPNRDNDYSLTDWLYEYGRDLGAAERLNRVREAQFYADLIRGLLGLPDEAEVTEKKVFGIIAEHLKLNEPTHTDASKTHVHKSFLGS